MKVCNPDVGHAFCLSRGIAQKLLALANGSSRWREVQTDCKRTEPNRVRSGERHVMRLPVSPIPKPNTDGAAPTVMGAGRIIIRVSGFESSSGIGSCPLLSEIVDRAE